MTVFKVIQHAKGHKTGATDEELVNQSMYIDNLDENITKFKSISNSDDIPNFKSLKQDIVNLEE